MTKKSDVKRTKWSLSQLEGYIRAESVYTDRVVFLPHVQVQMKKRSITTDMVFETLRKGRIKLRPELDPFTGDIKCRMEHFVAGHTVKMVVAISDDDPELVLVTAMN